MANSRWKYGLAFLSLFIFVELAAAQPNRRDRPEELGGTEFIRNIFQNRFSGLFSNPFDWVTVVAFFLMAAFYFMAPMMGYLSSRRGFLAASLWLMLAKILVIIT